MILCDYPKGNLRISGLVWEDINKDGKRDSTEKLLNAKTIVVKEKGHISQDDNVYELKEIIDVCNKMIK